MTTNLQSILKLCKLNPVEAKIFGAPATFSILVIASLYLTFRLRFVNLLFFKYILAALKDEGSKQDEQGKNRMSPVKAFFVQISATLGLGNISGSLFALYAGGPGTILWLIIFGIFFSIVRFNEIIMGKTFKNENPNTGQITGSLSFVLAKGFSSKIGRKFGRIMAVVYAVIFGCSVPIWSGFQLNQAISAIMGNSSGIFNGKGGLEVIPTALSIAILASIFWLLTGGLKRLSDSMQAMISIAVTTYILILVYAIITRWQIVPEVAKTIWHSAFSLRALSAGGFVAIFTAANRLVLAAEIGIGTACMPYASSSEKYIAKQAFFGILETIVVSATLALGMTLLMLVGVDFNGVSQQQIGINMSRIAIGSSLGTFPEICFMMVVFVFSFTTLVGNGYYVDSTIRYLLPNAKVRIVAAVYVVIAMVISIWNGHTLIKVIDFLLGLIIMINVTAILRLSGSSRRQLGEYLNYIKDSKGQKA